MYNEGDTIRMGQTVTLTCISHGGNPLAQIFWFKNGDQVDMSFTTSGRQSRNAYTFVATADDNNARFRCEAKNEMNRDGVPMTAEVVIGVQFAPEAVVVTGPATAKVGDKLDFDCETTKSNPPASIQWVVDGRTVPHNFSLTVRVHLKNYYVTYVILRGLFQMSFVFQTESPEGGWVTKSNLSVRVTSQDRNKVVHCYTINSALGETKVQKHVVSVLCKYYLLRSSSWAPPLTTLFQPLSTFSFRVECILPLGLFICYLSQNVTKNLSGSVLSATHPRSYSSSSLILTMGKKFNSARF